MKSLILCSAPEDEILARRLADFIEINLPFMVSREECMVGPRLDLMEAAERALSADAALVLLSPSSVPKVWDRSVWESALIDGPKQFQTRFGIVLLSDCKFPAVLRRQHFFDASTDALAA